MTCCLITFKGCLMILKCFFNDLSSSLNNCWVAEKTTKGGGGGSCESKDADFRKVLEILF